MTILAKHFVVLSLILLSNLVFSQEIKEIDDRRTGVYIQVVDIANKETMDSCRITFSSDFRDTTFRNLYGAKSFILDKDGKYKITINKSGYSEKEYELNHKKGAGSINPPIIFHLYPEDYSKSKRKRAYRKYKRHLRRKDRKSPDRTCRGMRGIPIVIK